MPKIAVMIVCYRTNQPEGLRLIIDRDYEGEDLTATLNDVRKGFAEEYTAFLDAGGTQ